MPFRFNLCTPVRFFLGHLAGGTFTGTLATALLMLAGPSQLRNLIEGAASSPMPLLLLWLFMCTSFAGGQMATAALSQE